MELSAVIPTKGDVELEQIRKHLKQYPEIKEIIFQNGDDYVYNRYVGIKKAKYDIIYTQDDDCITDVDQIIKAYEPGKIVNAMKKERLKDYSGVITLIGWGAVFDKNLISVLDWWEKDELFLRECDRVFTALTPHKSVFPRIQDLPHASSENRMGVEKRHWGDFERIKQRISTHKMWSEANEMLYWKRYPDEFYRDYVWRKYNFFDVKPAKVAVDVGGGRFGGALPFVKAEKKILVDYIDFKVGEIETVKSSFTNIALPDNIADAVFAWEVLDHADSLEDMKKGQEEIERILKPDGTLYFNQPVRKRPTRGHHVIISPEDLMKGFKRKPLTYLELPFYDNGVEIYATL